MLRIILLATIMVFATGSKKKRHHKSHEHGATTLDIVVSDKTADLNFRGPSESIFGFEHEPSNDKDKKIAADQIALLEKSRDQLVNFPKDRDCKTTIVETKTFIGESHKKEDDHEHDDHEHDEGEHGEHTEFLVKLKATCAKPLGGATLSFGLTKIFKRVHSVKVQVLTATGQFGKTIKNDTDTLKI